MTIIFASGLFFSNVYAAYAMQGAVLRRIGSHNICSSFSSGICCKTSSLYAPLVTTIKFSTGTRGKKRSKVARIKDLPVPRISRNCFGVCFRLIGQNREPIPPAIITQKVLLFILYIKKIFKNYTKIKNYS